MEFQFVHFYPDLMNLYGSYANLLVLRRLLERLGHTVAICAVSPEEDREIAAADFFFMGAGTERRQRFAMADFARYGGAVKAAAEQGAAMLFAGTAMELLGASVTTAGGETYAGIGLAGFTAVQGSKRIVEDVVGHTALFDGPVVGFMNKCTQISGVASPLLTSLEMGYGNEAEKGPEGYHEKNVFASELTGPLLVKNPPLLKAVASAVLSRRGLTPPETWPVDAWAEQGYAVTVRELEKRIHG